jgi:hypothetical protein
MAKKVVFSTISIRHYDVTIGDSPSVSCGIPLSLDWTFVEDSPIHIDLREKVKRTRSCFYLAPEERQRKLIENFGFERADIIQKLKVIRALGHRTARRSQRLVAFIPQRQINYKRSSSITF